MDVDKSLKVREDIDDGLDAHSSGVYGFIVCSYTKFRKFHCVYYYLSSKSLNFEAGRNQKITKRWP